MTEREFQDWWDYYQSDPWGEDRADLRSGIVAAILANQWSKRRSKPRDFLLFPPPIDPELQKKVLEAKARSFAAATQAKFKGQK
jgi:hypothetical protein